ncbi:MAG: AAA family ATPase, partial [Deltaproteobacteria bacterium]|nr:AAA family ATPase [Candidatus Tharpella aukensis]
MGRKSEAANTSIWKEIVALTSATNYFISNVEHVKTLELEAILHLVCGYATSKQINSFSKDKFMKKIGLHEEIETLQQGRKLLASIQQNRKLMEQKSAENGVSLKFVELCNHYELDDFEQIIILLLFAGSNSLRFHSFFEECDIDPWETRNTSMSVGTILLILCRDFVDQLDKRKYFAIDHPLVKHEIIELSLYNNINLLRADVEINDRFCRFVVDDQNSYDTDFRCISSETSTVNINQVIIDEKIKSDVISYTESFFNNGENRDRLNELYGYGVGLTFLFHGPSGTGKTMFAYGLANHFGKKLYSINVEGLNNESINFEDALKYAFKEARINNGIVFLDECDDILIEKTRESRTFMIEVEKANCITILATNAAVKLDPAMDRRINLKTFFPMSDEKQRAKIWKTLTPANIHLTEEDYRDLAGKYIFTGGLIKNTLVMALSNIDLRTDTSNNINEKIKLIAIKEIHAAAQYQANSIFDHNGYGTVITPTVTIEDLSINKKDQDKLLSLISYYPAILDNGHGFCGLISSTDLKTGNDCLEALALGCDAKIRLFSMAAVFNLSNTDLNNKHGLIDPFSQREMATIDYIFKTRPGQPEIIALIDDMDIFTSSNSIILKDLLIRLRSFSGTLFVLSNTATNKNIPIEFTFNLHLNFPSINLQAGQWKRCSSGLDESEIYQLINKYPMHFNEIDFVARNSSINAMLNENKISDDINDIMAVAARLRRNTHQLPE